MAHTSRFTLPFARLRLLIHSTISALSLLTFASLLFILPSADAVHARLALAIIAGASLIAGVGVLGVLVVPRVRCCRQRRVDGLHVGVEVTLCFAMLPLLVTAVFLEVDLAAAHMYMSTTKATANTAQLDAGTIRTLGALLLVITGGTTMGLLLYTTLLSALAFYTQRQTQRVDIWFADAAAHVPPFVFPSCLRFLCALDDGEERCETENGQMETLSQHTPAADCACGEKLVRGAVSTVGVSASYPAAASVRLPTDRERRRSEYQIGFNTSTVHL